MITAIFCILPYASPGAQHFFVSQMWLVIVCAVVSLVLACVIVCATNLARKVPTNYILLLAFTICEAYLVAFACAIVGDGKVVLAAAFLTAAVVVALTLYAVFTKTDFTACGGIITVLGASFFVVGIFAFAFGRTMMLVYDLLGVVVFGIYLVFDTQYIVGGTGRKHHLNRDDYILGSLMLYLDIINLFLHLLSLLSNRN